jgi:hypothetical protein
VATPLVRLLIRAKTIDVPITYPPKIMALEPLNLEPNLVITKGQIKDFWTLGIINDTTYIYFILKFDRTWESLKTFDTGQFIAHSQVEYTDEDGRPKIKALKPLAIQTAIYKLRESELISTKQELLLAVY